MSEVKMTTQSSLSQAFQLDDDEPAKKDTVNEAYYLFIVSAVGLFFNLVVVMCIMSQKHLRRMTSAFIIHGCLLDIIKCGFCLPFAHSLMNSNQPTFCSILGGIYVIVVTASGFNIVAMICCEAYTFGEYNVGREGRGSLCCVVFGIVMVYVGSIIIHLGPTIIGGNFDYNKLIGNCIFVYGVLKSYVVHAMWIAIMTLAMIGAVYYLILFYRQVQANCTHRIASLVRVSVALSRGQHSSDDATVHKVVRDSLSRARVLMTITALFIFCWYPLFILTIADPTFKVSAKIYKLLTFIAYSNSAVNPIVLVLFDRSLSMCRKLLCCCQKCQRQEERDTPLMAASASTSSRTPPLPSAQMYQRVGCRLCREGQAHHNNHCNGGVGKGTVVRDRSFCELHNFSSC